MTIVLLIIYLAVSLLLALVGLLFENIIVFDSILLAALAGTLCKQLWFLPAALCLLIGVVTFLILTVLQYSRLGFWLIGGSFSLLWSTVIGILVWLICDDLLQGLTAMLLVFFIVGTLHLKARDTYSI